MANTKKTTTVGNTTRTSITYRLRDLITEYKVLYLFWLYAPELLPEGQFSTFDDLKNHYQVFPKGITEKQAKNWLYEEPVQNALMLLIKASHKRKMVELYNIYFEKAKTDVQAFRAFSDFSNTFFADKGENELQRILNGVKIDDGSAEIEADS